MECLVTLGRSLTCCGSNQSINALLPVVCIPVHEYVYLLNCGSFRGAAAAAAVDTYEYENSFSDKPHQQVASYAQQYRLILLSWSVLYEHEHVVHEYTQTLAASSAAQHMLCRVCCVLSVLSTQPSVHPHHPTAKRDRWLAYFTFYRTRTVVVFLS